MIDYTPIPIYDKVSWDLTSEACHTLLIAPSGSGKTIFLSYLSAMALKRGHKIYLIDAKSTSFGATFDSVKIPTATNTSEIILMLTKLVDLMEYTYQKYFKIDSVALDSNFSNFNLPAHILFFDEVLAGLDSGSKQENTEIIRLLKQLALKGRMAGFAIVLTSQKLLSTDLPKAITDQCQNRYLLGSNVSEELFHMVLGKYKKELGSSYQGAVGKGYAITPKTGLTYLETPYMDFKKIDFKDLLRKLLKLSEKK